MRHTTISIGSAILGLLLAGPALAQTPAQSSSAASGDRIMRLSGTLHSPDGRSPGPVENITYSIYNEQTAGVPLWQETQSVTVDEQGRFVFLLGAVTRDGIPSELFAAGEPRWVGVSWRGQAEAPRYLLTAVAYALKASAADTLGGLPASAYQLTPAARAAGGAVNSGGLISPMALPDGLTNYIGKFVNAVELGNSAMFESAGKVGIPRWAPRCP